MRISGITKYFTGYLTIRVEGLYLEKFLNMSIARNINFWDVKRLSMTAIELKLNAKSYKDLKEVLNKTKCQVTIKERSGLPFSILKVKKRKMLGLGFIIFIFLVFMLSSFIWSVKITGAKAVSTEEIEKNLSELGVKPGAFKAGIDVSAIENEMLIRMNNISWIKIKLVGTRADVEIVERVLPPNIVSEDVPCNILARRNGIIAKVIAEKGDVLVSPGDTVEKGQILVTGVIERPNLETRYVHSSAKVIARTWYDKTVSVPLKKVEKVRTGNKKIGFSIKIGSNTYSLINPKVSYKEYDKIEKDIKLFETDKFELPLELVIYEYYETTDKVTVLTEEEAKSVAADEVEKVIIDSLPPDGKIIDKKIDVKIKNKMAIATASIETIEDIGTQEEINSWED